VVLVVLVLVVVVLQEQMAGRSRRLAPAPSSRPPNASFD
jgi:hypothetical protein